MKTSTKQSELLPFTNPFLSFIYKCSITKPNRGKIKDITKSTKIIEIRYCFMKTAIKFSTNISNYANEKVARYLKKYTNYSMQRNPKTVL